MQEWKTTLQYRILTIIWIQSVWGAHLHCVAKGLMTSIHQNRTHAIASILQSKMNGVFLFNKVLGYRQHATPQYWLCEMRIITELLIFVSKAFIEGTLFEFGRGKHAGFVYPFLWLIELVCLQIRHAYVFGLTYFWCWRVEASIRRFLNVIGDEAHI